MTTTNGKKYTKILDLARDASGDESLVEDLQDQMAKRQIVRSLSRFRNAKSISQDRVAQLLGCKQGKISKLENGLDEDLTVRELSAYAQALNCDLAIVLKSKEFSLVDTIKMHAMGIERCFDGLNALAKDDGDIAKGVAKFHIEAIVNLVEIIKNSASQSAQLAKTPNPAPEVKLAMQESGDLLPEDSPSRKASESLAV